MNSSQNRKLNLFISFGFFLVTMSLMGCVDLSGGRASVKKPIPKSAQSVIDQSKKPSKKAVKKIGKSQPYNGEVHTMLGGLGLFSTGMRTLSDTVVDECNISAPSDMWYNAGNVSRKIISYYQTHKEHRPIILVGHSLGANEQIKVARNLNKLGIPVDLLVTVDAVSQTIVPPNVKHAMNFYKPSFVPMFSGLKLKAVAPEQTRIDNINVTTIEGIEVNHFTIDKDPIVQAMIMKEVKKVLSNANKANG
ncbi:hypothetical protein Lgra_3274 [Legionella gratiana]|uniref:Thioesterase domain-containing protein n=1 Tax=Legionella gratiana TaxID=45066 RepID=A0A378JE51_9GAMM|nr:hypothetical protein [Legionella gratiana]KTD06497.1 hypothetical protein Lgra_3274 [Legionella gratiana]STX45318.1 Uncharacterised protein [Legionella gratiana]